MPYILFEYYGRKKLYHSLIFVGIALGVIVGCMSFAYGAQAIGAWDSMAWYGVIVAVPDTLSCAVWKYHCESSSSFKAYTAISLVVTLTGLLLVSVKIPLLMMLVAAYNALFIWWCFRRIAKQK